MFKRKKWSELTISNDFIFAKVMREESICKLLLEKLLDVEIDKLEYIEEQKSINITDDAKSVRFDVYVKGDSRVFDIEMQTSNPYNLPKRSRYYQSMMDLDFLQKGEDYDEMKQSYVIFICTFDPFGDGLSRYTYQNSCRENPKRLLEDGVTKTFFNAKNCEREDDSEVRAFLQYVMGESVDNEFVHLLERKVKLIKSNKEWEVAFMTIQMREKAVYFEGRKDGEIRGEIRGEMKAREEGVKKLVFTLQSMKITEESIKETLMEQYSFSEEKAEKYLQDLD